jgi:hypothetical protein
VNSYLLQVLICGFKIIDPPDYIEMRHSLENKLLNEGVKIRVVCLSRGGNPLPEIEWFLDNKKIQPSSAQSVVYTVESVLDLVLQRDYHNKVLECRSVNKVGTIKKEFTLNVSCKLLFFFFLKYFDAKQFFKLFLFL